MELDAMAASVAKGVQAAINRRAAARFQRELARKAAASRPKPTPEQHRATLMRLAAAGIPITDNKRPN